MTYVALGAEVIQWILEHKTLVAGVGAWLFGESAKSRFVVMGPGGVGKTTTGNALAGEYESARTIPGAYQESLGLESYNLKDDSTVGITVVPGQGRHRDSTWNEIQTGLSAGQYSGLILVSSYGYHSIGEISYKSLPLYEATGNDHDFLAAYLEDRRKEELKVVGRLAPFIGAARQKLWLLHIVTKADLWWDRREHVTDYYLNGRYGQALAEATGSLGGAMFRQETVFGSFVIDNFVTGRNELLATTVAGYQQRQQCAFAARLWGALSALKQWEQA